MLARITDSYTGSLPGAALEIHETLRPAEHITDLPTITAACLQPSRSCVRQSVVHMWKRPVAGRCTGSWPPFTSVGHCLARCGSMLLPARHRNPTLPLMLFHADCQSTHRGPVRGEYKSQMATLLVTRTYNPLHSGTSPHPPLPRPPHPPFASAAHFHIGPPHIICFRIHSPHLQPP